MYNINIELYIEFLYELTFRDSESQICRMCDCFCTGFTHKKGLGFPDRINRKQINIFKHFLPIFVPYHTVSSVKILQYFYMNTYKLSFALHKQRQIENSANSEVVYVVYKGLKTFHISNPSRILHSYSYLVEISGYSCAQFQSNQSNCAWEIRTDSLHSLRVARNKPINQLEAWLIGVLLPDKELLIAGLQMDPSWGQNDFFLYINILVLFLRSFSKQLHTVIC